MRGWLGLPPGLLSACPDGMQGFFHRKWRSSLPRSQEAGDASGDIASAGKSRSLFPERGSARRPRPVPTKPNPHAIVRGRSGTRRKRGFAVASGRSGFCFFFPKEKEEVFPRLTAILATPQIPAHQKNAPSIPCPFRAKQRAPKPKKLYNQFSFASFLLTQKKRTERRIQCKT